MNLQMNHQLKKKHLEITRFMHQEDMIIPDWVIQESNENIDNIPRRNYKPKSMKQVAKENIELDDKELNRELAEKKFNPKHSTYRVLKAGFNISLDSHHIKRSNFKLFNKSK